MGAGVVGTHGVAALVDKLVAVAVHIQWLEEKADPNETFVEQLVLPLALAQTYHLFYSFLPCAVSANLF